MKVNRKKNRLDTALRRLEIKMVLAAYRKGKQSKAEAGRILGINRTRVIEILKRHGKKDLINEPMRK